MSKMTSEYWRERKRQQRELDRQNEKLDILRKSNPVAFEDAVVRADRARDYAAKFPDHIRPSEVRFQDVEWQFHNESVKHYPIK